MLNVDIIFDANEYKIEVDKSDKSNFISFMTKIKEKLEIKEGNLKLMTINTKQRFLILSEDNFASIITEKFNGNIMKLYATIILEENNAEDKIEIKDDFDSDYDYSHNNINIKEVIDEVDEFLLDDKSEDPKLDFLKESKEVFNNDNNDMQEENKEKENNISDKNAQDNMLIDSNNKLITNISLSGYFAKYSINKPISFEIKSNSCNSIIYNNINKNNINNNIIENPIEFKDEECSICKNNLQGVKFICCICDDATLCQSCEASHPHHTIKYKSHFLSNITETYFYIKTNKNLHSKKRLRKLFKKEIELAIQPLIDYEISMRTNQMCKVPFLLQNLSKTDVFSDDFTIYIKNNKNIKIYYDQLKKFTIRGRNSIQINLICQSGDDSLKEDVIVEIFSNYIKLKDTKKRIITITFNVNNDPEEEKLNKIFYMFEKIKLLNKKYKELILYIMNEQMSVKGPLEIMEVLKDSNWKLEKALEKLIDK